MKKIWLAILIFSSSAYATPNIQWTTNILTQRVKEAVSQAVAQRCDVFGQGLVQSLGVRLRCNPFRV